MANAEQAQRNSGQGTAHTVRTAAVIIYATLALLVLTIPQSLPNWLRDMEENPVQQVLLGASGVQARRARHSVPPGAGGVPRVDREGGRLTQNSAVEGSIQHAAGVDRAPCSDHADANLRGDRVWFRYLVKRILSTQPFGGTLRAGPIPTQSHLEP